MNPITRFLKKLSLLFRRKRFASDLDEEMAFHREQAKQEFVAGGMTAEAAQYEAMRRFGNPEELKGAAVLLASDGASFITGQCIAVDGGYLASGVNS